LNQNIRSKSIRHTPLPITLEIARSAVRVYDGFKVQVLILLLTPHATSSGSFHPAGAGENHSKVE
jgi:hypothetical protein